MNNQPPNTTPPGSVKPASAPDAPGAPVETQYNKVIPALPQSKPGTELCPKVFFDLATLYIAQDAQPRNAAAAFVLVREFLLNTQLWSSEMVQLFFESRRDLLLPVFHSHPSDFRVAWKLYRAGLYNPFIMPHTHPPEVPDWGGFLLSELPHWYLLFTRWHRLTAIVSSEVSKTDRRRLPRQARNFKGNEDKDAKGEHFA
jgi:hypothetical protein